MNYYTHKGTMPLGQEGVGTSGRYIDRDLKTLRGVINRNVRQRRLNSFTIYTFTNVYDNNTYKRVYQQLPQSKGIETIGIITLYSMENYSLISEVYINESDKPINLKVALKKYPDEKFLIRMNNQQNQIETLILTPKELSESLFKHPHYTVKVSTKHIMK
jgi:hypothetical protein